MDQVNIFVIVLEQASVHSYKYKPNYIWIFIDEEINEIENEIISWISPSLKDVIEKLMHRLKQTCLYLI